MSRYHIQRLALVLFTFVLIILLITPQLSAEDHVISQAGLHQALVNASATRQSDIAKLQKFFLSPPVQKALGKGGMDLRQVEEAVPTLNDQELAQLAKKTQKIQNDFTAGSLSNEHLTYIVIALATAVILILIFKA